ncbi:M15 family metallopeptidase [Snodgrassella gandavensis]|uniref:M15 family metallopeptidase n=1 Tax=Snodgrassella gandavensis TaxID=2946698 RepID=UPI001EF4E022|nr:M15 family metallopeptidase [Snodgrassella gandavensis]
MYKLGKRSLNNLQGVNPNRVKVVERAMQSTTQDFTVVEGKHSKEQCSINYGKGRMASECTQKDIDPEYARPNERQITWVSQILASKHATGRTVDIYPYPINMKDSDLKKFKAITAAMKQTAAELGVTINLGSNWQKIKNLQHFEVVQ